jgi:hypothetical protein
MHTIPTLTYMDGETVSQLVSRTNQRLAMLADAAGLREPTEAELREQESLLRLAAGLREVVAFLNSEHAEYEARPMSKRLR